MNSGTQKVKIGWLMERQMTEFVVIVESGADAETATKLAERVLLEEIEWLEHEQLQYHFQWSGLEENTDYSCWKDIRNIVERAKESGHSVPKFLGHSKTGALKSDGASAWKVLNLVRSLQKRNRLLKAVIFIRDLDNQPNRKEGINQARLEHINLQPKLEIVIGVADRMREAWVLNGFVPLNSRESQILNEIRLGLDFDPCNDAQKLRSTSSEEPDRERNPKVVVEKLTGGDRLREQKCWEETNLNDLRERGGRTGLTDYLHEVKERLTPIIIE